MGVAEWFSEFCSDLRMSSDDVKTVAYRYGKITGRINKDYYTTDSETYHSIYVGSYGRGTEIYLSDIDMLVRLPYATYQKFNAYSSNGQSALLQEVKDVLAKTYSTSKLKGDGQIVAIPFTDGINFEVLPAFLNTDGSYAYGDSNGGGTWKTTNPSSEIDAVNKRNAETNRNLKRLCRMARAWKSENMVPISGILIDIFAYNFIGTWEYRDKSYLYYDYMSRDFFKYVKDRDPNQEYWYAMGSGRRIDRSGKFESKAKTAYETALTAIEYQVGNKEYLSKLKWREIYGSKFPD